MTAIRHPSAALTIAAATVAAWLGIIAIGVALDDSSGVDRAATKAGLAQAARSAP
jgi:hypothetical protein